MDNYIPIRWEIGQRWEINLTFHSFSLSSHKWRERKKNVDSTLFSLLSLSLLDQIREIKMKNPSTFFLFSFFSYSPQPNKGLKYLRKTQGKKKLIAFARLGKFYLLFFFIKKIWIYIYYPVSGWEISPCQE